MKFRSKPTVIEAEQFFTEKPLPFRDDGPYVMYDGTSDDFYVITAHAQRINLAEGDWVVKEPVGPTVLPFAAAYPIKPDIFAARYEPEAK